MNDMRMTFKEFLIEDANPEAQNVRTILRTGINKMLRMSSLQGKTDKEREASARKVLDAFDIIEALEIVRDAFKDTEDMVKAKARKGKDFDFIKDVKKTVQEFFMKTSHMDEKDKALARRRYGALYHLVLEPLIDTFKGYSHEDALNSVDHTIKSAINYVKSSDVLADAEDALKIGREVRREIAKKQNVRNIAQAIAKMRVKKKKK